MRVLHVIPSIAVRYGGPSQLVVEMCQQLNSHIDVELVTTNADGDTVLALDCNHWIEYQGIRTRIFHRWFSESFKYAPAMARWLRDQVGNYDLVHIHAVFSHACMAAARACRKARVPYIFRPLGTLDPWSMSRKAWKKSLFMNLGMRGLLQDAAAIHYTSTEEMERTSRSLGLDRGVIVPNGIHGEQYAAAVGRDGKRAAGAVPPFILYLGRLDPKKNLEALLDGFDQALSRLAPGERDYHLKIAGDGDARYVQQLKDRAATLSCAGNITFTGWVSGETKLALLRDARLFVLPSHNENYGISMVEAMASATAVLCSDQVAIHADVVDSRGGWVCARGQALSGMLVEAMSANDLAQRGDNARQWVLRHYDWSVVTRQVLTMYRNIAKGAD